MSGAAHHGVGWQGALIVTSSVASVSARIAVHSPVTPLMVAMSVCGQVHLQKSETANRMSCSKASVGVSPCMRRAAEPVHPGEQQAGDDEAEVDGELPGHVVFRNFA